MGLAYKARTNDYDDLLAMVLSRGNPSLETILLSYIFPLYILCLVLLILNYDVLNVQETDPATLTEARHAVLDFLVDVVTSQYSSLDVMRLQFFG